MAILLAVLGAAAIVLLTACWLLFRVACVRIDRMPSRLPADSPYVVYREQIAQGLAWFRAQSPVPVSVTSRDGLRLAGQFLKNPAERGVILLMHGFRGGIGDFAVVLRQYYEMGFSLLAVDQRAHGDSEGRYICFGAKERYDCADWVHLLTTELCPGTPILLDGISMGASTVLLASDLPLDGDVRGIIADCGYSNVAHEFRHVCRRLFHLPLFPLYYLIVCMTRLFAGFDPNKTDTADSLRRCTLPVLFLHGTSDRLVPYENSQRNFDACAADKQLELFEGAGHGESYLVDEPRCLRLLQAFCARVLDQA